MNPPKEITDPDDRKPEDWDERERYATCFLVRLCAFSYIAPHAWNLLPENVWKSTSIAIYKHSLKTFFEQIMHLVH